MSLAVADDKPARSSVDMTGTSHPQTWKRAGLLVQLTRGHEPGWKQKGFEDNSAYVAASKSEDLDQAWGRPSDEQRGEERKGGGG